jgi:hypothetical protein
MVGMRRSARLEKTLSKKEIEALEKFCNSKKAFVSSEGKLPEKLASVCKFNVGRARTLIQNHIICIENPSGGYDVRLR